MYRSWSFHFCVVFGCACGVYGQQAPNVQGSVSISLVDAVSSALSRHPQLEMQRAQISTAAAARLIAASDFDLVIGSTASQNRSGIPLAAFQKTFATAPDLLLGNTTNYSLQASKLFRNGLSVAPTAGMIRSTDNQTQMLGLNTSQVGVQIMFPLMRGHGREVVTAKERAAALEYDASILSLQQTTAQVMLNAGESYWALVAATKRLQVAQASEIRGKEILTTTQALIEGDQLPRAELNNAIASFSDRVATRIAAQANLTAARQKLALDIGFAGVDLLPDLQPSDDFPNTGQIEPFDYGTGVVTQWQKEIQTSRPDLLAARKQFEAASILRVAAKDALRPSLNLSSSFGYAGLRQGTNPLEFLASPFATSVGMNVLSGLQYSFAPSNHLAQGQIENAVAAVRLSRAKMEDLQRGIESSIVVSLDSLRNSITRLRSATQAVSSFREALEGEKEKLKLGAGSLTDVLLMEDRLTSALLNQVDAQEMYVQSIAEFRYATGTLVSAGTANQRVDLGLFRDLPDIRRASAK